MLLVDFSPIFTDIINSTKRNFKLKNFYEEKNVKKKLGKKQPKDITKMLQRQKIRKNMRGELHDQTERIIGYMRVLVFYEKICNFFAKKKGGKNIFGIKSAKTSYFCI